MTKDNDKRRHDLLGLEYKPEAYDIRHFNGLTADNLKALIAEGFADPSDAQNSAPDISEMLAFLEANPQFTAHGYVVQPYRPDCRVSIEGVEEAEEIHPASDTFIAFIETFRSADEFSINPCRAWYD